MIRRPPRSTQSRSSAASDVYKRQLPCDTSFITAFKNKNHDCIVGMYHDALQSGLKAFGFDRGVTVQGGLPLPITTPAHGTAFDIAGKNKANLEPTLQSFKIALTMAENKSKQ